MRTKMDVVIPVALKDKDKLEICVDGILKNSMNPINKVFIVTESIDILESLTWDKKCSEKVVVISEEIYPFSKRDIEKLFIGKQLNRKPVSWYYQQLLKLYVFDVIPNICENVLILDSDFVFIKPIEFLTSEGKCILSYGHPLKWFIGTSTYPSHINIKHRSVTHAKNLVKNWNITNSFSGMHHHMIFDKFILKSLIQNVEEHNKEPFWKAFINTLFVENSMSSASEYVIYFHFAINNFEDKIELRHLSTIDIIYDSADIATSSILSDVMRRI